ncbi:hypothetical protein BDW59DRAFT_116661 [Aspergillus cavernicola]|uniref:Uncharacterized protein n=1 Tax=Aspergillus cavernicola TaxID=176166 RepID=A0ABR4HYB0_9EURO
MGEREVADVMTKYLSLPSLRQKKLILLCNFLLCLNALVFGCSAISLPYYHFASGFGVTRLLHIRLAHIDRRMRISFCLRAFRFGKEFYIGHTTGGFDHVYSIYLIDVHIHFCKLPDQSSIRHHLDHIQSMFQYS